MVLTIANWLPESKCQGNAAADNDNTTYNSKQKHTQQTTIFFRQ